jgi:hypothetical protein
LPRVLIEQELASGQLVRIGAYAAINAQKTYLMFPEQRRDWAPFVAFAAWLDEEMARYRAQRRALLAGDEPAIVEIVDD